MALGASLGIPFGAAYVAALTVINVADDNGLQWGYFLGVCVTFVSLMCGILFIYVDK